MHGLELADAQILLGALAALREPVPRVGLETVALLADRFKAQSVALEVKRRLR